MRRVGTSAPSWELLDADGDRACVLAALTADEGTGIQLLRGEAATPIASFAGETVRMARLGRDGGSVTAVLEDAHGDQRLVALERNAAAGSWTVVRTFALPPGSALDLDPDAGLLFASTTDPSGAVDVVLFGPRGGRTEVYDGGGWIFNGSLSPDGTGAALLRSAEGRLDTQLLACRVGADEPARELMPHADAAGMGRPCWTPDGASVLLASNVGRDLAGIAAVDVRSGQWRYVWEGDHDADIRLAPGSGHALVHENVDGECRATAARCPSNRTRTLASGARYILPGQGTLSLGHRLLTDAVGRVFCTFTDHARPAGIWRLSADAPAHRLTPPHPQDGNPASRGARTESAIPAPERIHVVAADGVRVPVFVRAGARDGDAHDTKASVVCLHGGPTDQWRRQYSPLISALQQDGIAVLTPDPRGSTGFGKSYAALDDGIRHLDAQHDLDAVHGCLADQGLDPVRCVLMGFSFGGYQTLTALTRPGSPWAAGIAVSAVSDPLTYLESTPLFRRTQRELTYGSLEQDRAMLERWSPMRNAGALHAPLLLVHGERDGVVPVAQTRAMAAAARAAGGSVTLRTLADAGHQIHLAGHRAALISWVRDFIRTHTGEACHVAR